ncbi:MAG: tetratricopeptide repeat protein [Cyanobacteria bacterium CRU_2_1]|nr:tetratricopeptide repeat protein [Cyanobacteria bacterium RU_5_0]NJR61818.1 tetratricopeptide repeat protein [Cyanobacteria bacterium CRU_2_1]
MKLSLCMIVKNEVNNLPRCLHSVKDVVDEMIVLDTGSTDETVTIAQAFGANVQYFAWCNDFSAARNESLQYANGDWILVLDADEVLATANVPMMQQAIQRDNALVINLVRQEIGAVQSPYSLVSRLFRNHPDIYFSRPYHAIVDDSVTCLLQHEPHWQILNLPEVAILHYGYEPGAIASRNKLQKARTAMEGFLVNHPDDPYVCSKLGALYVQMGDFTQGIELLNRGLHSINPPHPPSPIPSLPSLIPHPSSLILANAPMLYELHYHLGVAYSRFQQVVQAEQHYRVAIQQPILDCLKLGAYNNLGSLLKVNGDLINAKAMYEACLAIDPAFAIGYYNLGMTLKAMGQMTKAIDHYQTAIDLNPHYAEAYQNLGVVLLKLGNVAESLQAFRQAIVLHKTANPQEAERLQRSLKEMGFQV